MPQPNKSSWLTSNKVVEIVVVAGDRATWKVCVCVSEVERETLKEGKRERERHQSGILSIFSNCWRLLICFYAQSIISPPSQSHLPLQSDCLAELDPPPHLTCSKVNRKRQNWFQVASFGQGSDPSGLPTKKFALREKEKSSNENPFKVRQLNE